MTETRASANLFLDKSRKLKGTNKHPVNIRVCHNRKQWMTGLIPFSNNWPDIFG
jgi:hypothetical protein